MCDQVYTDYPTIIIHRTKYTLKNVPVMITDYTLSLVKIKYCFHGKVYATLAKLHFETSNSSHLIWMV